MDMLVKYLPGHIQKLVGQFIFIAVLFTAPVGSYALKEGIPAIKLLSIPLLIASGWISSLFVFIFVLVGLYFYPLLKEPDDKVSSAPRWKRILIFTAIYIFLTGMGLFILLEIYVKAKISGVVFVMLMTAIIIAWTSHNQKQSQNRDTSSGIPSQPEVTQRSGEKETKKEQQNRMLFWISVMIGALFIWLAMTEFYFAPLGKYSLRTMNMGGGLSVQIDNGPLQKPITDSLILETADGWFVRSADDCGTLLWIAASNLDHSKRLTGDLKQNICSE